MDEASAQVLRDAFEALEDGVAVFDADRRLLACNARYAELLAAVHDMLVPGTRWEDLLQACAHRHVYVDAAEAQREWLANVTGTDDDGSKRLDLRLADGRVHSIAFQAIRDGGFLVSRSDVTDRRRKEAEAAARAQLAEAVLAALPVPAALYDLDRRRTIYASPGAVALMKSTDEVSELIRDPADWDRTMADLRRDGAVSGARVMLAIRNGETIPATLDAVLAEIDGRPHALVVLCKAHRDTDYEGLLRGVVQAFPAPILMTRAKSGQILFKSPEIDRIYGSSEHTTSFWVEPTDRAAFLGALRRRGEVEDYRARFRGADGRPFWGAVAARLIEYEGEEVIVSYSRDLTRQMEIEDELGRQREQLFQNEKIAALGTLLAGISHELNNPLSVVVGHAMMLEDEAGDPEVRRHAGKISEAAARCTRVVRSFLTMAREKPERRERADLDEIVATAVDVAGFSAGAEIDIQCDPAGGLPPVEVDADQITQVVINLILNAEQAIQASGQGGRIIVRTMPVSAKGTVSVVVEDDGPGIPPDLATRIFEPLFSTRAVGEGTGMGLAFCHRMIRAHGGEIRLDPDHTRGARFVIDLPVRAEPDRPDDRAGEVTGRTSTARVLIIDDEADVAELHAEVLARAGYDVVTALSAHEAVDLMRKSRFDAVVSDLNMPGPGGRGFFEMLQQEFRDLMQVTGFITGDTMGRASQSFLAEAKRPYLEKPVTPAELRDFVGRLLADGIPR